jgi:membrane associated rhomboid family serine protease
MLPLSDDTPTRRPPVVTPLLMAINILVFVAWEYQVGIHHSVRLAGLAPRELHPFSYAGFEHLFTCLFMHAGVWHLMGNMWFLWVFGDNVEDEIGRIKFLGLYLLCGVAADLAYAVCNLDSTLRLVGASGAISGVLGAYLILHPTDRVRFFFLYGFIRIPVWFYLLFWIGFQVFALTTTSAVDQDVAYAAHVGGFVAGIILAICFRPRKNLEYPQPKI